MNKKAGIIIVIVSALLLAIMAGVLFYIEAKKENEIMSYNTIVIGGQNFSTSGIKDINRSSGYSNQVKIEFKDGSIVYTDCYILKDN